MFIWQNCFCIIFFQFNVVVFLCLFIGSSKIQPYHKESRFTPLLPLDQASSFCCFHTYTRPIPLFTIYCHLFHLACWQPDRIIHNGRAVHRQILCSSEKPIGGLCGSRTVKYLVGREACCTCTSLTYDSLSRSSNLRCRESGYHLHVGNASKTVFFGRNAFSNARKTVIFSLNIDIDNVRPIFIQQS